VSAIGGFEPPVFPSGANGIAGLERTCDLPARVGVVGHLFGEIDPLSVDGLQELVVSCWLLVGSGEPKAFSWRLAAGK
jgi:hypothetical protein